MTYLDSVGPVSSPNGAMAIPNKPYVMFGSSNLGLIGQIWVHVGNIVVNLLETMDIRSQTKKTRAGKLFRTAVDFVKWSHDDPILTRKLRLDVG